MDVLNPLYAIVVFLIAFFTAYLIKRNFKIVYDSQRFETIDGLRGFLAIGVFIFHSSIWYFYIQNNIWDVPASNFFAHLGQTSVTLFFMITSFLFISKLLATKETFNWKKFYISRIYRLAPMYYFSLALIIICIMVISHWHLNVSPYRLMVQLIHSGIFNVFRWYKINGYYEAYKVNAVVTWSLPYEWLFYLSLPILSIFILKKRPTILHLLFTLIFVFAFYHYHGIELQHILSFVGGAIAPYIIKYTNWPKKLNTVFVSIAILLSIVLMAFWVNPNTYFSKGLCAIIFTLIACGNNLFGILKNSTLKLLGEVCYSTYLLHGILLFAVFYFGFGILPAKILSPMKYFLIICAITPVLVIISFCGFRWIEQPFMNRAKKIK